MIKPFDTLYNEMEKALKRGARASQGPDKYLQGIKSIRANQNFWQYYRAGSRGLDQQFTRACSRNRILEPLTMIIDQEGATMASYRAAWCLATYNYGEWLKEERALLSSVMGAAADLGYSWGPPMQTSPKASLIEKGSDLRDQSVTPFNTSSLHTPPLPAPRGDHQLDIYCRCR
jgi:hypothetical protein